jgi:hypothetical protein
LNCKKSPKLAERDQKFEKSFFFFFFKYVVYVSLFKISNAVTLYIAVFIKYALEAILWKKINLEILDGALLQLRSQYTSVILIDVMHSQGIEK